ncbi:chalcone isomerase family protein [Thermodesulfobacteriota bacterium]
MKKVILMVLIFLFTLSTAEAVEVAGVNVPDTISAGEDELVLNGGGARKKFFMKMYVGALYLLKPGSSAEKIIKADESMAITLHITSSMITSERMEEATREGFTNSTGGDKAPIKDEIEEFISVFKEKISEKDVFELVYSPGKGVEVFKNSSSKVVIKGLEFKKALFGIWLCDKPAQKSLKNNMLGK